MATHALIAPHRAKQSEERQRIDGVAYTRTMKFVTAAIGTVPESNESHNYLLFCFRKLVDGGNPPSN
jgi:hypothetical protein